MADQADGILSPWLRKQRIKMAAPYIRGKVMDYGCGVGKLAEICSPNLYFGIDIDEESLKIARKKYPYSRFESEVSKNEQFDTIVLLAVIEHMKNPETFLKDMKYILVKNGKIIITTPPPIVRWIHYLGAKIGLFSDCANEEHEQFIDYKRMQRLVSHTDLVILYYKRFLFGVNQLFILGHKLK